MTIKQVADALGLKVRTIRQWIRMGKIKAEKVGKCWQIPAEELERKEILTNANKGREHSRRIKEGRTMGVLAGGSQDSQKSL